MEKSSAPLKEYHCPFCHKLLCKGWLKDPSSLLEVKCNRCRALTIFTGANAEIVQSSPTEGRTGLS